MDYIISCCSTVDLSKEHLKNRNVSYICFHYSLDGKDYADDLGESMPFDKFYQAMASGSETKTSQVNVMEYVKYFKSILSEGHDLIHVTLSSGLSGSYNSACLARDMVLEDYPARKLYVVDSRGASSGSGLLVDTMCDLRDKGMDIDSLYKWTMEHRLNLNHWFFSTDLTFYVKGGRISKAAGWFGTALKICPLLNVNDEGRLIPRYKVRGKKLVKKRIVEKMKECAYKHENYPGKCFISHSNCLEDALEVKNMIAEAFPNLEGEIIMNSIGTTIGSHTGPGTVAVFFWGEKRGR